MESSKNNLQLLKTLFQRCYAIAIVTLLVYWFYGSRDVVFALYQNATALYLFFSILVWVLAHFINIVIIKWNFKFFVGEPELKKIAFIHFNRLPYKYLPGGVWNTVARAADYSMLGFKPKALAKYFIAENMLIGGVTFFLGGCLVYLFYIDEIWRSIALAAGAFGGALLLFTAVSPKLRVQENKELGPFGLFPVVLLLLAYWLLLAISFLFFIKAFSTLQLEVTDLQVMATYVFAWAVGFVAFFAPQGIGVSELVASQLLYNQLNVQEMISFLVGFRLIGFVADISCFVAARALKISQQEYLESDEN